MKSYLIVFGGVFGSLITAAFLIPIVLTLAGAIGAGEGAGAGHYFAILFLAPAALGLAGTPFFAIINYLEPENPLQWISAILVIASGAIAVLAAVVSMFYGFSIFQLIALITGALVIVSGLLQGELIDMAA
jgi:hypothetical protein